MYLVATVLHSMCQGSNVAKSYVKIPHINTAM